VDAASKSVNAVVHVTTETMVNVRDPFADFFGATARPARCRARGGFRVIVSDDGYIVTNNHVVEGADKISVSLNDLRKFDAVVIGRDPSTDLALLKIEASGLSTLPYGDSDALQVGQWVLAVGNPMNLTSSVTAGIVSAKARNINLLQYDPNRDLFPIESFIQTDAGREPRQQRRGLGGRTRCAGGQSTRPFASNNGQYAGYSFAIPASIVKKVRATCGVRQRAARLHRGEHPRHGPGTGQGGEA
jgi:S1-C subfamily serine protease